MLVRDVMVHDVERVGTGADLAEVAAVMWSNAVGAVVVVDASDRVVGMVTDRDLAMAAFIGGRKLADIRVIDTMPVKLATIGPDATLAAAAEVMRQASVRRLPVVDEVDRLVGIVSITDLALAASHGVGVLRAVDVTRTVGATGTAQPRR